MPIQLSSYLRTVFTNMVFYERPKRNAVKRKTSTMVQPTVSVEQTPSPVFCSQLSKSIRHALEPHIKPLHQKSVQSQFTDCLEKWISGKSPAALNAVCNIPHIHGFDFNEDSSITDRWKIRFKVQPVADNLLELHIPTFVPWDTIAAPAQTIRIVCSITATSCNILHPEEQGTSHFSFVIPYDNHALPARTIPLSIPSSDGCLCITTVSLHYELKNGKTYNRPAYTPCSVIDARYQAISA